MRWLTSLASPARSPSTMYERAATDFLNADVFSFELTPAEMERIDALDLNQRIGPDPDVFPRKWA